ncbi:MAG: hypothetical protein LBQ83_00420, partial [Candidatus Margulisbacteria bacterium]|nr:hypothetical protein [Candidatus Margulisiibacteriota bacterium]
DLHRWLVFFDKNTPEETLREILNMDKTIQEAQEKIRRVSGSEADLRLYELREKGERDYASGLNFARREGEQKGFQTSARKMKALGISPEQIREITGLSPGRNRETVICGYYAPQSVTPR